MRSKAIARAILEDREQRKLPPPSASGKLIPCFQCAKAFAYPGPHGDDSGRFCSGACRIEYDCPGASSFDSFKITCWRKVAGGDPGYLVATPMQRVPGRKHKDRPAICGGWRAPCRGCCKPFESFGWAYCSQDCKHASRQREVNEVDMAAAGIERPTKRKCLECGDSIPRWRNGRAVSKAIKYCSDKCAARARRKVKRSRCIASQVFCRPKQQKSA
jgi:hypothetical protein